MHSLRLAVRSLLRSPGFTTVVVLSLGLGVGACTSVFATVWSIYSFELPFPGADRVVEIGSTESPRTVQRVDMVPHDRIRAWLNVDFRTLELFAARGTTSLVLDRGEPERVAGELVSGSYFEIVRVPALMGRWLNAADDAPLAERAAVVSESLWKEKLGGEESVLGSGIKVSGGTYTVVGVMPEAFAPTPTIWLPASEFLSRGYVSAWFPVGRLREGSTLSQAAKEVHDLAASEFLADSTLHNGYGAVATPFAKPPASINNSSFWIMSTSALAILLLAATNLGALFLVRGAERGRSAGIRLTLGASAWQLGRGVLMESVLLGLGGAIAAIMLPFGWNRLVTSGVNSSGSDGWIDPITIAFAGLLSLSIAVLVGSEPLRHVLRLDLRALMQGTTFSSLGPRRRLTRNALVGTQVGLAMTFATIGVVLSVAYTRFSSFDLGYDPEGLVIAVPDWGLAQIQTETQPALMTEVVQRVETNPMVESAAIWRHGVQRFPPKDEVAVVIDGPSQEGTRGRGGLYRFNEVGPGFFRTLGIPIVAGRDFGAADDAGSAAVAIVSEAAAKAWWPGQDPIGHQVKLGEKGEWMSVVGVAADAAAPIRMGREFASGTLRGRQDRASLLYRPLAQGGNPPEGWLIDGAMAGLDGIIVGARAKTDVLPVVSLLNTDLTSAMPNLSLQYIGSLQDWQVGVYTGRLLKSYRATMSALAGVAFFLALLGVVGIVSEGVVRRTREIGIRKALGARAADVTLVLAREGFVTTMFGVVAGVGLVFVLGELVSKQRSLSSLLSGRSLLDWPVLSVVAVALLAAAVIAASLCTVRANRMETSAALRVE